MLGKAACCCRLSTAMVAIAMTDESSALGGEVAIPVARGSDHPSRVKSKTRKDDRSQRIGGISELMCCARLRLVDPERQSAGRLLEDADLLELGGDRSF